MSDRIFGLVVIAVALGYILSASGIQESFLSDPLGPKAFPFLIGAVCALCGLVMVISPDPDPQNPKAFASYVIQGIVAFAVFFVAEWAAHTVGWLPAIVVLAIIVAASLKFAPMGAAVLALLTYSVALAPMGFLLPTALAAALISYLIRPNAMPAVLTGVGLSVGLFVIFKYGLGLGLFPVPRDWMG